MLYIYDNIYPLISEKTQYNCYIYNCFIALMPYIQSYLYIADGVSGYNTFYCTQIYGGRGKNQRKKKKALNDIQHYK